MYDKCVTYNSLKIMSFNFVWQMHYTLHNTFVTHFIAIVWQNLHFVFENQYKKIQMSYKSQGIFADHLS